MSGPQHLISRPLPPSLSPAWLAMARPIAQGHMTVPWSSGGDPGALDLATNLAAIAFDDGRTVWDELCARHGLSACSANVAHGGPRHAA